MSNQPASENERAVPAAGGFRFCCSCRRWTPTKLAAAFEKAGKLSELESVFGFLVESPLNGGRNRAGSLEYSMDEIADLNAMGVGYSFTLSSMAAAQEHLEDPWTNTVLKRYENPLNSVVVATPIVENYIRARYPGYKLRASCIYNLKTVEAINEATRRFDMVTLWPEFSDDDAALGRLENKEKIMLFGTQVCLKACGDYRMRHYYFSSLDHIAWYNHRQYGVPYNAKASQWTYKPPCRGKTCPVQVQDIDRLRRLGFRHIKIVQPVDFAEHYLGIPKTPQSRLRSHLIGLKEQFSWFR